MSGRKCSPGEPEPGQPPPQGARPCQPCQAVWQRPPPAHQRDQPQPGERGPHQRPVSDQRRPEAAHAVLASGWGRGS